MESGDADAVLYCPEYTADTFRKCLLSQSFDPWQLLAGI